MITTYKITRKWLIHWVEAILQGILRLSLLIQGCRQAVTVKAVRRRRGQITMEYFLIAAALGILTILGFAWFPASLKNSIERLIDVAATRFGNS